MKAYQDHDEINDQGKAAPKPKRPNQQSGSGIGWRTSHMPTFRDSGALSERESPYRQINGKREHCCTTSHQ